MNLSQLVEHVERSYRLAEHEMSKLSFSSVGRHILSMDGMSGKMWRHFLNNLCSLPGCVHLEIGTWAGSTFCSSIYGNRSMHFACTVDNNSQFGNVSDRARTAIDFTYAASEFSTTQVASLNLDYKKLISEINPHVKFDTYYFDGPHDYEDQYNGIMLMKDYLNEERCVILVDDWNWVEPRNGTLHALETLNREIVWSKTIITELEDGPKSSEWFQKNRRQNSNWHNGVAIFVLGGKK